MREDTCDEVKCGLAKASVLVTCKEGLAVFPEAHVDVHAATVVTVDRLGHECGDLVVATSDVAHDVAVPLEFVSHGEHAIDSESDFTLASGSDLVVVDVCLDAHALKSCNHLGADVVEGIVGLNGEVSAFVTSFVAEVRTLITALVPCAFFGVDGKERGVRFEVVTDFIKEEEFSFRTSVHGISDACTFDILHGFLSDVARVARVGLTSDGVKDVTDEAGGGVCAEWVHASSGEVGTHLHIGSVDGLPCADGATIKAEALFKEVFVDAVSGDGDVVPLAEHVGKFHVYKFALVVLDELDSFFG